MAGTATWLEYRKRQVQRYFRSFADMRRTVNALRIEAQAVRERAEGLRGQDMEADRITGTPSDDMLAADIQHAIDLDEQADAIEREYAAAIELRDAALESLGGSSADLLRLHYCAGMSLAEIGRMNEWRHERQYMSLLHIRALADFYDYMPHMEREPIHPAI